MAKCKFRTTLPSGEWECPFEALPGEEYCYWHKEEEGKNPDNTKLEELKENEMFKVFLRKANLSGRDLQGVRLPLANLEEANLKGANLQEALLRGTNLKKANLVGANLQNANLFCANLEEAKFSESSETSFETVIRSPADLQGAVLASANLQKGILRGVNLQNAWLEQANLNGADLERANLREAGLMKADLQEINLKEANLEKADLSSAKLQKANLEKANLREAEFVDADLPRANLQEANLERANFRRATFQEANLLKANLKETKLENADLCGTNFSHADLRRAELRHANLQGANLEGAKLQGADFWKVKLERANLSSVMVNSETRLDKANLTYANLYLSYITETKTFRNAIFENEKEINEFIADLLENKEIMIIDVSKFKKDSPKIKELIEKEYVLYVHEGRSVILFDKKREVVIIPSDYSHDLRLSANKSLKNLYSCGKLEKYLYEGSKIELYEASCEVYKKLHEFYIQNGKFEEAMRIHCKKCKVTIKRLKNGGWLSRLRAYVYNFFYCLSGYGVQFWRPITASLAIILIFALLFRLTKGIIKNVNGKIVTPDFWDYLYHSAITFTTLGYSNIQPNLATGHLPQMLAAIEAFLGALMMALLIYVVTNRVSRY